MSFKTLNNQNCNISELCPNNDNLNDDDYDVTWGGQRSRYIYNYVMKSPGLFENSNDTTQTESVRSDQSKTTIEVISETDLQSIKSCGSNCDCNQSSDQTDHTEFEIISSSSTSSCHIMIDDSNYSSDSSTFIHYQVPKDLQACDTFILSSDNGYYPDETDININISKTNLPPPACFKTCVQCKRENPNPYFQYCYTCFRYRMKFFEDKPIPKSFKHLIPEHFFENYEKVEALYDQQLDSIETYNLYFLQEEILNAANIENNITNMYKKTTNVCNVCLMMPQNGVFNHGKIGHIYCCYTCAKKLWKTSKKCPICHVRVQFITKMIVV